MKYINITLSGFKYMAITGYDTINITPHSPLQLILGTNGSGKTSLMKEISPLPGDKDAYKKGGFKEVTIEHKGIHYKLKTDYSGNSPKCSFINLSNDEELNQGGTQQVQLQLVKDIFNYDNKIHTLIHSLESFTEMSPTRRREYFTSLSSVSYTYALSVWQKLKDQQRDIQGALKNAKKNLLAETSKSISEDDIKELQALTVDYESKIAKLQTLLHGDNDVTLEDLQEENEQLKQEIIRSTSILAKAKNHIHKTDPHGKYNIDGLNKYLNELNQNKAHIEGRLTELNRQHDELKDSMVAKQLDQQQTINIDELSNEILHIQSKLENNLFDISLDNIDVSVTQEKLYSYQAIEDSLSEIIQNLPVDGSRYTTNIRDNESNILLELKNKRDTNIKQLAQYHAYIQEGEQHQNRQHNKLTCPSCKHVFRISDGLTSLEDIKHKYEVLQNEQQFILQDIKNKEQYLEECEHVFNLRRNFKLLSSNNKSLNELWVFLDVQKLNNNPILQVNNLNQYKTHLKQLNTLAKLKQQLKEQLRLLEEANKVSQEQKDQHLNKLNKIEQTYHEEVLKLNDTESRIEQTRKSIRAHQVLIDNHNKLQSLLKDNEKNNTKIIKKMVNNGILDNIRYYQSQLGSVIQELNHIKTRQYIIEEHKRNIDKLLEEERLYKILIDEISPTTGLIADGLTEFIRLFIAKMNQIIGQIWSYPLEIKAPSFEEGSSDLNYKFPMLISQEHGKEVSLKANDVANGSSGIKEVVNLAFKLVALQLTGMGHYPLFLDEFGAAFDLKHRSQASNVIKNILEGKLHEQLFMISHYHDSYGALVNADVIVMSPDNITIPSDNYNQQVQFSNMEIKHE